MDYEIETLIENFYGAKVEILFEEYKGYVGTVVDVEEFGSKTTIENLRFGVRLDYDSSLVYYGAPELNII